MHWSVFALAPCTLALAFWAMPSLKWRVWCMTIAAVAVMEILVTRNPGPDWEARHTIALWCLGIVGPWVVFGSFLVAMRARNSRLFSAVGLVVVYFLALATFLAMGDAMGLLPQ